MLNNELYDEDVFSGGGKMQNVIIIDGDMRNAECLKRSFNETNKSCRIVEVFNDGSDAMQYLEKNANNVDYIITDVSMPGYPELELIEQIKMLNQKLKCIILSVQKVFDYAMRAMELGVVRYLLKPMDGDEMSRVFDTLLDEPFTEKNSVKESLLSAEVRFVKNEIETNYKDIDMDSVAVSLGYSKEYLYRTFKKEMKVSVNQFIQDVRLEKAKEYLQEPGKYKIYEVCELVGYDDQMYFSKLFKKRYNITAKEYQKYAIN